MGTVVSKFPHLILNSVIVTVEMAQSLMILDLGVKQILIRTVSKDLPNCKMESIENLFSRDYDLTIVSVQLLCFIHLVFLVRYQSVIAMHAHWF